ncbi:MAG TPA: CoA transferase [Acetobacteraceae bacterium]|jgi:crotonobetainyl-CoA:carnitine CoA-transferase CaiB-like acyl-CoA transferase
MNPGLPLSGIRVTDLTRVLSGPFCSMLLGDLGADVIKVETPGEGDAVRHQGAGRGGLSWYFANYNRNKRSITLNLRSDEGRAILARLIARSDVLLDNYRPGVLDAMGFTAARLAELNPRLVRGSVTGFGSSGPYRDRPSFDFIAQAMSGFMSVNGAADQPPMRSGPPVSDLIAGLYAALGVVAGLLRERRTGQGGSASVSLIGGLISFLSFMATDYLATGRVPTRTGNDHPIGSPYGLFRTADGEIAIAPAGDAMYQRLLRALNAEDLRQRPEFATNALRAENRAAINAEIEARTKRETSAHWIRTLNAAGVPCSRVMHLDEVFADPQVIDQQAVVTVEHPGHGDVSMLGPTLHVDGAPLPVRLPAPELGANTVEVLEELGLSTGEIDRLRERGVV